MPVLKKIYYIDRSDGNRKEEKVYFEKALRFLYGSYAGKSLNFLIAKCALFSHLFGWWQRRPFTQKKIAPFISKFEIDTSEFAEELSSFPSFDQFFIRKLKPDARPLAQGVILPADGRYLVYQNIKDCDDFVVKGKAFTLEKLLKNGQLASQYAECGIVIARLCPTDYHRFHFPIDCLPTTPRLINGPLYSVNPIALKENIAFLSENKRVVTQLSTEKYGTILYLEIGATNVGSIHQTFVPGKWVKKGEEKGYFSFGGSTLILLFERGKIHFASDLLENSLKRLETRALLGQNLEQIQH